MTQALKVLGLQACPWYQQRRAWRSSAEARKQEAHLQALLDLLGQPHARASIGRQIDQRQLLLQRVLRGRAEDSVLSRAKGAAAEGDVICYCNYLRMA